jgi:hypothetical protein
MIGAAIDRMQMPIPLFTMVSYDLVDDLSLLSIE